MPLSVLVLAPAPAAAAGPVALAYAGVGLLFALYFAAKGVSKLDPTAEGAGIGFRVLIIPGAAALWPVLLVKLLRGKDEEGRA